MGLGECVLVGGSPWSPYSQVALLQRCAEWNEIGGGRREMSGGSLKDILKGHHFQVQVPDVHCGRCGSALGWGL